VAEKRAKRLIQSCDSGDAIRIVRFYSYPECLDPEAIPLIVSAVAWKAFGFTSTTSPCCSYPFRSGWFRSLGKVEDTVCRSLSMLQRRLRGGLGCGLSRGV